MSKLINNEGATKATFSILENLKEAEDLKIKKRVLAEGYGKTSVIEGEDCEDKKEEVTEDVDSNAEQTDSTLEECPIAGDGNVPDGAIDPVKEGEEITEEEKVCEGCGKKEFECTCKKEDCEDDKIEERVCEGLEIVNIKGNTVLLKESKGYIVGKNYDKETGLIESAEEYKTEKVANKAFKRLSSRK